MFAEASLESRIASAESNKLAVASLHDARVRELEKLHVATWSEMAELCIVIQDNCEWECLGFESFNAWLLDAAPKSRSAMYVAMGLVKELAGDVATADLRQIEIGSAKVLAKLPKKMRKKPETIAAAKRRPREFVQHVQKTAPELHIETIAPRQFAFTASQERIIQGCLELVKLLLDITSDEEAIEAICADFIGEHQEQFDKMKAGELI